MSAENIQKEKFERLEHFIGLARSGKKVTAGVSLKKEIVKQTVKTADTDDLSVQNDMCLYMADFALSCPGAESGSISKVYAFAPLNENEVEEKTTRYVANERLKMDYRRLWDAGIKFDEKLF